MINVPYLLSILETDEISELVSNIDEAPIDINLAIWGARDLGEVEIDEEKGTIKALVAAKPSCDEVLAAKLYRVMGYYADKQKNITRGRLNTVVKDPTNGIGYGWHEYLMALQWLIDSGKVIEYEVEVPEKKKSNPYHKFVFLGIAENDEVNEEWNQAEVDIWVASHKEQ